jgi:hypothetical protein
MTELTVIFKGEDKTYRQKFLLYETYGVSEDDQVVLRCIHEAQQNFDGEVDTVQIKIHMEIV